MKVNQLNEYIFRDKDRERVKVGDAVEFEKAGLGGSDGKTKGIVKKINGSTIDIINLDAKEGEPDTITVKSWEKIDIKKNR